MPAIVADDSTWDALAPVGRLPLSMRWMLVVGSMGSPSIASTNPLKGRIRGPHGTVCINRWTGSWVGAL